MLINFYKYQATGNDFIILDNRESLFDEIPGEIVQRICSRRFGIGADGLMLMNNHDEFDFEMIYYNADGNRSTMCGNGGRCMVKFAYHLGLKRYTYRFIAVDGYHEAEIDNKGWIRLKMNNVENVTSTGTTSVLDTGSPHYIKFVNNVSGVNVVQDGREIRNNRKFSPEGINVNFVEHTGDDSIYVRTYERGVEDETLSCGTGVTAAALVSAHNEKGFNRVSVKTPGGLLSVEFNKLDDQHFENVWLCGPAEFVFKGEIEIN